MIVSPYEWKLSRLLIILMSLNIPSNFHSFTVLQIYLQLSKFSCVTLHPQLARHYRAY